MLSLTLSEFVDLVVTVTLIIVTCVLHYYS